MLWRKKVKKEVGNKIGAKCPICNENLVVETTIYVGGVKGEEHEHCPNEHYYYSYTYGVTRYIIGNKQFGWSYHTPLEEKGEIRNKIDKAINKFKEGDNSE